MNYNKLIIGGHLGQTAELRSTATGKQVCRFSVAVNRKVGDEKETMWVNCAIWGDRAAKLQPYLVKGTAVLVDGEMYTTTTEKNGKNYTNICLNVDNLAFAGNKEQGQSPTSEDEIPF